MNSEMLRAATYIFAPYDTVWTAVTRPDQQGEWYVAPCLDFGWEPGERVAWGKLSKPVIEGTLTEWNPATRFAHTFSFTNLDEPESLVEWDVTACGEVVWIEVKHYFDEDAPQTQAIITDGWTLVLARLKTLLETGRPMPWPDWEEEEALE
jgi:uncharacterized protein YndB with AHSA1/START domain